jgi:CheY-like chemotaxis protein
MRIRSHLVLLVTDVDDRRRAEEARTALLEAEQSARVEAEAANRAQDEFLAMLGHELRNPLGALSNAVHLLDGKDSDRHTPLRAREVIRRQVGHLSRLVDDLLDTARVATGKIVLTQKPLDLAEAADRSVRSVFTVRFPRVTPERIPEPEPATVHETARQRVLVVEDNPDGREMLRHVLAMAGHEVHERADGPGGLAAALELDPDLVLIDIGLPGLDGYGVARGIRSSRPNEPIVLVALTGYGQAEDRKRALEAGFDAHLVKPIDPETLLEMIGHATAGRAVHGTG